MTPAEALTVLDRAVSVPRVFHALVAARALDATFDALDVLDATVAPIDPGAPVPDDVDSLLSTEAGPREVFGEPASVSIDTDAPARASYAAYDGGDVRRAVRAAAEAMGMARPSTEVVSGAWSARRTAGAPRPWPVRAT